MRIPGVWRTRQLLQVAERRTSVALMQGVLRPLARSGHLGLANLAARSYAEIVVRAPGELSSRIASYERAFEVDPRQARRMCVEWFSQRFCDFAFTQAMSVDGSVHRRWQCTHHNFEAIERLLESKKSFVLGMGHFARDAASYWSVDPQVLPIPMLQITLPVDSTDSMEFDQATSRLSSVLEALKSMRAGRLELVFEDLEVGALVEEACNGTAGLLVNKPIELAIEVDKGLPAVQGDRVRLNQVLYNLLSNAAKFTDEGHIAVRAYVDREGTLDEAWMCLEVKDTGTGISEEDQDKIFERFQQVDGSNSRKAEGTGLGLAITRHLVQMHGGTIGVHSQPGEGSTFTVRLPLQRSSTLTTATA